MAVRIRMKKLGRKHRPFYRICAMDQRSPRGGKVLEELGTYDPMVRDTNARALLNGERIEYWLGVGAQPSEKVQVLIKKYGLKGTHLEQQQTALNLLSQPRAIPDPGKPASLPGAKEAAAAEAAAAETAAAETESAEAETAETESAPEEPAAEDSAAAETTEE